MLQDLPDLTGMTVYLREFPENIPLTLHPQMDAVIKRNNNPDDKLQPPIFQAWRRMTEGIPKDLLATTTDSMCSYISYIFDIELQSRHKLATMDIDTYIELGSTTRQERQ